MSPAIKKMSFYCLPQLEADVQHLIEFQSQFDFLATQDIFLELQQLLAFLQLERFEVFLETRAKKFSKLRPQTLLLVLEKYLFFLFNYFE